MKTKILSVFQICISLTLRQINRYHKNKNITIKVVNSPLLLLCAFITKLRQIGKNHQKQPPKVFNNKGVPKNFTNLFLLKF